MPLSTISFGSATTCPADIELFKLTVILMIMVKFSEKEEIILVKAEAVTTTLASPGMVPVTLVREEETCDTMVVTLLTAEFKAAIAVAKICKTGRETPLNISAALATTLRTTCKAEAKTTERALAASITALVALVTVATTDAATAWIDLRNSREAAVTRTIAAETRLVTESTATLAVLVT